MPPKKDGKKQAVARPDNSGIPKQDVEFKFNLSIKSDTTQLPFAVMIQWFGLTSDKIQRTDAPLIDAWQKTDSFNFQKACDPIRVDDDFCKTLSQKRFYVYFINAEDNKVEDIVYLDYSSLLMFKGQDAEPIFKFQSNTIKVMGIDSFELKLTANKELLQQTYRHYLNPFEVQVIGAKDVPVQNSLKYQPTYIKYDFFDGATAQTYPIVGQDMLVWNQKHVFLAGLMDPAVLKERLRFGFLKFELHDRDELQNKKIKEDLPLYDLSKAIQQQMAIEKPVEQDPKKKGAKKQPQKKEIKKDAKKDTKKKDVKLGQPLLPPKNQIFQNNYGIGAFYLVDFLKPSMRTARYKSPIVPKTTFEDLQSKNIDLNTTARNEMQKIISSNNYFERDTNLVVGFTISYPIGTFVKPAAVEAVVEDPKKKKDPKDPVIVPVIQKVQKQQIMLKDVFERVVYLIPYKSPQYVTKIDNVFYECNTKAFNLKNKRQISTYLLKPEDKTSLTLDYLTGIQLIDNESRIYIFEGLKQGAMKKLHEVMMKTGPNTKQFKIFKNSTVTFLKRLYTDFNIDLKRVRFRPSLSQLLLDPIIYIKSKVPEQISLNLNRCSEIKKICDDLKAVDSMNLWPEATVLVQIQRKFSDSLTYEDINGVEQEKKRKGDGTASSLNKEAKAINFMKSQELKYVTVQDFTLPKIANATTSNIMTQSMPNATYNKKFIETKTFNKDETKMTKTYDMRLKKAEIPLNEPVYIYAGQKNNWYEKQMKQMRDKINQDPKHIYTYSKDYLSLSIDPRVIDDQTKRQNTFAATKNISPQKFQSLIVKTKDERMHLPKGLAQEDRQQIKNNPYHLQKSLQKELKKNTRDLPITEENRKQFQKYIKKQTFFQTPEVLESEKISPTERFRMEQQEKKRIEQENRKKLLGDSVIKIKKCYPSDATYGIDRFEDIRQGPALKKGIVDIHKKTKEKRPVDPYEVSFQLKEQKIDPSYNPLIRRDNSKQNTAALQFNHYQRPEVITFTSITKPLKKSDL